MGVKAKVSIAVLAVMMATMWVEASKGADGPERFAIGELAPRISLPMPERGPVRPRSTGSGDVAVRHSLGDPVPGSPGTYQGSTTFVAPTADQAVSLPLFVGIEDGAYSTDSSQSFIEVGSYVAGKAARHYWGFGDVSDAVLQGIPAGMADPYPQLQFGDGVLLALGQLRTSLAFEVMGPSRRFVSLFLECDGATHLYTSKVSPWAGYSFAGDQDYPLTFKKVGGVGYVYICGRGTVTARAGETVDLGSGHTVDTWLPLVTSEDQLAREGAAQALGYLTVREADKAKTIRALGALLRDGAMEVRRNAAEALGRIGDERGSAALFGALDDSATVPSIEVERGGARYLTRQSWLVADVAAESLARIGGGLSEEQTRLLAGDLRSGATQRRVRAARALVAGGDAALGSLTDALRDSESEVRKTAARSLGDLGDRRALEALRKAIAVEADEAAKSTMEAAVVRLGK